MMKVMKDKKIWKQSRRRWLKMVRCCAVLLFEALSHPLRAPRNLADADWPSHGRSLEELVAFRPGPRHSRHSRYREGKLHPKTFARKVWMDLNGLVKLNTSLFTFHIFSFWHWFLLYLFMWRQLVSAWCGSCWYKPWSASQVTFSVQPSSDSVSKVLVTQSRLFVQHTPQRVQYGKHTGSPLHRGCGFARGVVD